LLPCFSYVRSLTARLHSLRYLRASHSFAFHLIHPVISLCLARNNRNRLQSAVIRVVRGPFVPPRLSCSHASRDRPILLVFIIVTRLLPRAYHYSTSQQYLTCSSHAGLAPIKYRIIPNQTVHLNMCLAQYLNYSCGCPTNEQAAWSFCDRQNLKCSNVQRYYHTAEYPCARHGGYPYQNQPYEPPAASRRTSYTPQPSSSQYTTRPPPSSKPASSVARRYSTTAHTVVPTNTTRTRAASTSMAVPERPRRPSVPVGFLGSAPTDREVTRSAPAKQSAYEPSRRSSVSQHSYGLPLRVVPRSTRSIK